MSLSERNRNLLSSIGLVCLIVVVVVLNILYYKWLRS